MEKRSVLTPKHREQAAQNGIKMSTVYRRISLGWSAKEAVTIPVNSHYTFTKEDLETAAQNGVNYGMLQNRLYVLGWPLEECIHTPKHGRYVRKDAWI